MMNSRETCTTGRQLKQQIEIYFEEAKTENPILAGAIEGSMTARGVVEFLDNIFFLIQHTNIFLRVARARSMDRGDLRLAEFYAIKLDEERGHERWAEQDIANISQRFNVAPTRIPAIGMIALTDTIRYVIDLDPKLYLAYIMFAEHFTVLATPLWTHGLERHCGITPKEVSVITNHGELDKGHVIEMIEAIGTLAKDERYAESMPRWLDVFIHHHRNFCKEVVQHGL